MLIVPTAQVRRPNKPDKPAVVGTLAQAKVVAVLARGGNVATWFFSVPVVVGVDLPQLILDTDAGPQAPTDMGVLSDYALNMVYGDGDIESGITWHMDSAAGLSFGSVPVVLPQSGTVIE